MTMLNPELDSAKLAAKFAEDDRIRISNILNADVAERIRDICLTKLSWDYLSHVDGKNRIITSEELKRLGPDETHELQRKIGTAAAEGIGFFYCSYMMDRKRDDTDDEDIQFLHDVFEFLNSDEMLAFVRDVTGRDDLKSASAQYTRYTPGHFLTRHRDDVKADKRRIAYVLAFSKDWHPDWGGLLHFYEDDGTARDAWVPEFNSLSLFDVRHVHSVSYVTPFTKQPRLSLTGWFRAMQPN